MSEQGYNGWKNYPTWAVNLWLSNDEPLYRETLERTQDEIAAADDEGSDYLTSAEWRRYRTADMLKDWVSELADLDEASFRSDLLGYALGEVDWHEIADAWIESVADQVSA